LNKVRGIGVDFANAFKNSVLYGLYKEHKDELFLGVRDDYLNLYYNCDCIAKIEYKNKSITCEIDKYYLDGKHYKKINEKRYKITPDEICKNYRVLKKHSNEKTANEKKAQSKLVVLNNKNKLSNWFCIDIEYEKSDFRGRFDIIAISKNPPHKTALIELKYGNEAIGGNSGIYEHIKNFIEFCKNDCFRKQMKKEIVSIIKSLKDIDKDIPINVPELNSILPNPDFYFITLDNNAEKIGANTPKQKMGGYLFNDNRWHGNKIAKKHNVQDEFGDVTKKSNEFYATFLFSKQTLEKGIKIKDIIDGKYNERIIPK